MDKPKKNRFGKLLINFLAVIPFPLLRLLARLFSNIAWYANTRIRKVVTINIELCFPELAGKEKQKLIKKAITSTMTTALEMPRIWLRAKDNDTALYAGIEGNELIEQALAENKNLIIITPHLGQWEYMLQVMGNLYPCTVLCNNADDIVSAGINNIINKGRTKTGAETVEASDGIKPLIKALKSGRIALIPPDQVPPRKSGFIFTDFFGQPAATMTFLSRLAKITNAELLSGYAQRQEDGRYKILIRGVDPLTYSGNLEEAVTGVNRTIERLVSESPAQYLWTYKRFRLGPEGKRKIYLSRNASSLS